MRSTENGKIKRWNNITGGYNEWLVERSHFTMDIDNKFGELQIPTQFMMTCTTFSIRICNVNFIFWWFAWPMILPHFFLFHYFYSKIFEIMISWQWLIKVVNVSSIDLCRKKIIFFQVELWAELNLVENQVKKFQQVIIVTFYLRSILESSGPIDQPPPCVLIVDT